MLNSLKKLCIVTTGLDYGGAEIQLVNLAISFRFRGWVVDIISMLPPKAFLPELSSANIPVHCLNMRRGIPNPIALFKLTSLIRRLHPTVIHSHMIHANLLTRLVHQFSNVSVLIGTAHSINEGGFMREFAYRMTDFLCDITTQVSQSGMDRYIRVKATPKKKIRFIPNGVNLDRFYPDLNVRIQVRREFEINSNFVWLAVGRFEAPKDYKNLIHAFSHAHSVNSNAILLLVGDGALRPDIEQLVKTLGLSSFVKFLGIRNDIPALMNSADAYVMSSQWEGMPIVLLEASATGLPILATRVGGIPEVVQDGVSGMLVSYHDSMALASGMSLMMGLATHDLKRMGLNGLDFTRSHYCLNAVVDQWERLYYELLAYKGII
jgi:glycosyltransferase involved in cell wall biosynthesis